MKTTFRNLIYTIFVFTAFANSTFSQSMMQVIKERKENQKRKTQNLHYDSVKNVVFNILDVSLNNSANYYNQKFGKTIFDADYHYYSGDGKEAITTIKFAGWGVNPYTNWMRENLGNMLEEYSKLKYFTSKVTGPDYYKDLKKEMGKVSKTEYFDKNGKLTIMVFDASRRDLEIKIYDYNLNISVIAEEVNKADLLWQIRILDSLETERLIKDKKLSAHSYKETTSEIAPLREDDFEVSKIKGSFYTNPQQNGYLIFVYGYNLTEVKCYFKEWDGSRYQEWTKTFTERIDAENKVPEKMKRNNFKVFTLSLGTDGKNLGGVLAGSRNGNDNVVIRVYKVVK